MVGIRFSGVPLLYPSAEKVELDEKGEDGLQYPVQMWNNLTARSALHDHNLTLKLWFPAMLPSSIHPLRGHVDDARYKVRGVHINQIMLKSFKGDNARKNLALLKMACNLGN